MNSRKLTTRFENNEGRDSALQNPIIISKILSNLFLKDLKMTRLVNSYWFQESKKHFYQRASLDLFLARDDKQFQLGKGFESYQDSYQHHKNIYIPTQGRFDWGDLRNQIVRFVNLPIINLNMEWDMVIPGDCEFLATLLNNSKELEDLTLSFSISIQHRTEFLSNVNPLMHLKKLTVDITMLKFNYQRTLNEVDKGEMNEWSEKLLKMTPNLEHLSIPSNIWNNLIENILEKIIELQSSWKSASKKKVTLMPFQNLCSLAILKGSSQMLNLILKLQQPLKKLKVKIDLKDVQQEIQEMFEKNFKYLEILTIIYTPFRGNIVLLPNMQRLECLTLKVISKDFDRRTILNEDLDSFQIGQELNNPKLQEKFPKLESLTLNLKEISGSTSFNCSIPNDSLTIKQFKQFSIRFFEEGLENKDLQQEYLSRLSKIFPNVNNPRLIIYYKNPENPYEYQPYIFWRNFDKPEKGHGPWLW